MKRLITIILALIMALFTAPNQSADQGDASRVNAPQTAVTASVEQEPAEREIPAETAKKSESTAAEAEEQTTETVVEVEAATTETIPETEAAEAETQTETLTEETTDGITAEPVPVEEAILEESITEEVTEAVEIAEEIIVETETPSQEEPDVKEPNNAPEYKPSIGGENPFLNNTPTEIDDTPVEDYIGEGEDRSGEGIHF